MPEIEYGTFCSGWTVWFGLNLLGLKWDGRKASLDLDLTGKEQDLKCPKKEKGREERRMRGEEKSEKWEGTKRAKNERGRERSINAKLDKCRAGRKQH